MNKKEGNKGKGDSKTKIKPDKEKGPPKKNDSKKKAKTTGEDQKKSSKDTQKRASKSPSKVDAKDKSKSPVKAHESVKKSAGDATKVKKVTGSDHQKSATKESKSSLKSKHVKEDESHPSKDAKVKTRKGDTSPVKKSDQAKKHAKTADGRPPKTSSKSDASPKKAPAKKTKDHDDASKENDDNKTKAGKDPKLAKKTKTSVSEPPRKTPTPNYEDDFEEYGDDFEDDFEEEDDADDDTSSSSSSSPSSSSSSSSASSDESGGADEAVPASAHPAAAPVSPSRPGHDPQVLNSANNPDTHTKQLATAVRRKEYTPPADTYARQDWDPGELKKAIDSENKQAETFDPVEFHKQKKARAPTSAAPSKKRRPSATVSFIAEEPAAAAAAQRSPVSPQPTRSVDFSHAKKQQQHRKSAQQRQGRGRALLSLIELFEQDFDLFELEPASYDQILVNFGKSGLQQGTSQTNEDDLTEEIQTDEVRMRDKWTQHPIQFDVKVTTNDEGEVVGGPTYYDYLGVGGDMEEDLRNVEDRRQSSAIRLNKFLGAAGSCMLMLLEEGAARTARADSSAAPGGGLSFSSGSARLGAGVAALLADRPATHVSFCDTDGRLLLTAHSRRSDAAGSEHRPTDAPPADHQQTLTSLDHYGLLCVWSLNEPSQPQKVLLTSAQPACCCFSPVKPRLAFAGSSDGSLDVWDLHEAGSEQSGPRQTAAGAPLRSPTYSTAEIHRAEAHTERLVALRPVPTGADAEADAEPGSFQMCSLDAAGRLVFWVAISSRQQASLELLDGDLGLAPWGRVKLVKISHVCVDDFLDQSQQKTFTEVYDFRIDPSDPSHIYVSTDSGAIIHCTRQGSQPVPRLFRPDTEVSVPAWCLAFCPFEQPFLLAGGGDGSLRLHGTSAERPLITWNSAADGAAVRALCWSRHRPCVFFVLDADSKIHVWDLSAGDIFPAETDQVKSGQVTAMDLGYGSDSDQRVTHLAVSTVAGTVDVHTIADSYTRNPAGEAAAELDQFLHYVRII